MICVLSSSPFSTFFKRTLEHNQVNIPEFVAKLIGQLSLIRRNNGDLFLSDFSEFSDHSSFLIYCRDVQSVILEIDFITSIPILKSRFKTNDEIHTMINTFFSNIYKTNNIDEVIVFFITELNWIVKGAHRDIASLPASKIYEYTFVMNQDNRIYGFRNYRTSMDNLLIFSSSTVFNNIHAFISVIFFDSVYVKVDGITTKVDSIGMFDSVVDFDINSDSIIHSYISSILCYYNSSSPTGQDNTLSKPPYNKIKNKGDSKNVIKNNESSASTLPTGKRSYSSYSRGKNDLNMPYNIEFYSNGKILKAGFTSSKAMLNFINSYFKQS